MTDDIENIMMEQTKYSLSQLYMWQVKYSQSRSKSYVITHKYYYRIMNILSAMEMDMINFPKLLVLLIPK